MQPRSKTAAMLLASLGVAAFAPQFATPRPAQDAEARATASAKADVQKNTPQRLSQLDQKLAAIGGWRRYTGRRRPPGTGWPVAVDRRRAKKSRNRARNRAAHR